MKALNWITNRHVLSALCAAPLLLGSAFASAEEAAPAEPAAPYTLSFNLGLYSNYMFRGVELSDGPALQGGIDWAHSSGFYLGTWWSNIDPYNTGKSGSVVTTTSDGNHLETDWYGGYAHTFENGFGVNVLGNYYFYPEGESSYNGHNQDSFEASIALSYKWFTYTYYRVLTDYYGLDRTTPAAESLNTDGADYHELKVNYALPFEGVLNGVNVMAKVGYQRTPGLTGKEGDYAIGLTKNFSLPSAGKPIEGFSAGLTYTGTFDVQDEAFYVTDSGRDTNSSRLSLFVKRAW